MKLVAGLGNPSSQYMLTRHSVGFEVAEALAQHSVVPFEIHTKLRAEVARSGQTILMKPTTYMNESGAALRAVWEYFIKEPITGQALQNLWVIHDDLDLALGTFKIQFGTGPKIHNGLLSAYQYLKTDQFWHVRIGVDNRGGQREMSGSDYVLQRFTDDERAQLAPVMEKVITTLATDLAK